MTFNTWILFGVAFGPLLYLIRVFFSTPPKTATEFHTADREILPSAFIDSSLATAFQDAAGLDEAAVSLTTLHNTNF